MYLKQTTIQNFRGIEHMTLNFQPGINLLIGDNGAGKTTILEAIATGLNGLFANVTGVTVNKIPKEDFRTEKVLISDASTQRVFYSPSVELVLDVDGEEKNCIIKRDDPSNSRTIASGSATKYLNDATNSTDSLLPLLSYMGISRVAASKRTDYGKKLKNKLNDRRCGYIGCLDTIPDKNSILDWIMKMSYESKLHDKTVRELDFFQSTVSSFMKVMSELPETPAIYYSATYEDLVYESNGVDLPIRLMSAGYQSILWMAMDFAFRLALLNPTISDPAQANGVVLIDEIDMHLHPKWQWNVLNALHSIFPNVQFILATHAPIVIASCKGANLQRINDDHKVSHLENAYAYPMDAVLSTHQQSSGMKKELLEARSSFDHALNTGNMEQAKQALEAMEAEFGQSNPSVIKARTEYSLESIIVD